MASNVFAAAMRNSLAEGNDRNVLLALADCAWRDGVTWILVGDDKHDDDETLCRLARVHRKTVWRAIQSLLELGDIQTLKVRRGRSFVTVYRVLHGAVDVDYERIPFDLPHRFDESPIPVEGGNLTRSTPVVAASRSVSGVADASEGQGGNLTRSTEPVQRVIPDHSTCQEATVQRVKTDDFNVSAPRAHVQKNRKRSSSRTEREPEGEGPGDPAAAEPAITDREVAEIVNALPGADTASPKRIGELAYGLPRSVFLDAVETMRSRRPANPCGLLTHLLRIVRAERAAQFQAEFMAAMPSVAYAVAPWTADALKRDDPERYVRLMASLSDADLKVALAQHHSHDRLAELLELAARVRAGEEPAAERETPEQARLRWVSVKANERGFPIGELHDVIDDWQNVDDIERGELHALADQIRTDADDSEEVAA